ncbi:hypothetical protein CLCR_10806 [Cladophialophora carrionii]|uniref:BD-FAE-like domain-containing protein n=1 Tax=Cladophialophora carrionii TaxID=86049 RepID=A0A1C1CZJ1_9EURO|nr:hypothetical protein CLCR_10806 [Cladophialophora carrionii]
MNGPDMSNERHSFPNILKACIHSPCAIFGSFGKSLGRGYSRMRALFDRAAQNSDQECLDGETSDSSNQEETEQEDFNEENHNIQYVKHGHHRQTLDLYLPPLNGRRSELTPVVIYIRYDICMPDNPGALRDFVQSVGEYALAFVDYRDDDLPAAVYDCKAAIRWLRAHAAHYKLDPDCFIVWGKCDAGLLAAILGTTAHLRVFDVGDHLNASSAVQGVMA